MAEIDFEQRIAEGIGFPVDSDMTRETGAIVFCAPTTQGSLLSMAHVETPHAGRLEWLWPGHIPLGCVTLIEGPAGAGKSFVALDLAARLSDDRPWADGTPQEWPGSRAVVLCRQDHHANIVGARLEGLGYQPDRVDHFQHIHMRLGKQEGGDDRPISFPLDLPFLERMLHQDESIRLVVIDPLSDFCTKKRLEGMLEVLNEMAHRRQVAIVVTLPAAGKFDRQGQLVVKSKFHTESARCQWCCLADPNDPERRLLLPTLMNYAKLPMGRAFTIGDLRLDWQPDDIDPRDACRALSECETWLEEALEDGEEVPVREINKLGSGFGYSPSMLHRAAKRLKVQRRREGFGPGSRVFWAALRETGEGGQETGEQTADGEGGDRSLEELRRGVEERDREFEEVVARVKALTEAEAATAETHGEAK